MRFGLRNATAAFQREMIHILSGFPWRKVIVYIDDVLIMGDFPGAFSLGSQGSVYFSLNGVKTKTSQCKCLLER